MKILNVEHTFLDIQYFSNRQKATFHSFSSPTSHTHTLHFVHVIVSITTDTQQADQFPLFLGPPVVTLRLLMASNTFHKSRKFILEKKKEKKDKGRSNRLS